MKFWARMAAVELHGRSRSVTSCQAGVGHQTLTSYLPGTVERSSGTAEIVLTFGALIERFAARARTFVNEIVIGDRLRVRDAMAAVPLSTPASWMSMLSCSARNGTKKARIGVMEGRLVLT